MFSELQTYVIVQLSIDLLVAMQMRCSPMSLYCRW